MRKYLGILVLLALSLRGAEATGLSFKSPEQFVLADDQAVTNELWLLTAAADIRGTVEDDLIAVGSTLIVAGDLRRDLWALGESVDFTGRSAGHVRIAGRTLEVRGTTSGNLLAIGQSVRLSAESEVSGDAVLLGEDVVVEGRVRGRTRIFAPRVTLSGKFDGTVHLNAQDIVVQPGTEIRGDLVYTSSRDLILDQRVVLSGELIREEPVAPVFQRPTMGLSQVVSIQVLLFSAALLVALPFLAAFPGYAGRSVQWLKHSGWKCALAGFAAFGLFPMAIIILPFTLIGIPLSAVLLLLFLLLLYISKLVVGLALGGWILRRRGPLTFWRAMSTLGFGLVLLYVLVSLPGIGLAVWLLCLWLGLGSLILAAVIPTPAATAEPPPLPGPEGFPRPPPPLPPSFPETKKP
ncbi:MAG: hypothetical protein KKC51_12125 [Verrucomicrobia bacterium]|nr:hypothetical protein [Verrucomicrobiota bacterium]